MKFIIIEFYVLFSFFAMVTSCNSVPAIQRESGGQGATANNNENRAIASAKLSQPERFANNSIRNVDFENFTYGWFPDYAGLIHKRQITLKNGKNDAVAIARSPVPEDTYQEQLNNVTYVDLDDDGNEEAIVTLEVNFYKYTPVCIFVFSYDKARGAAEMWRYETGTIKRSFRGLKLEGARVIVEEYDQVYDDPPSCCPKRYFRTGFELQGKSFAKVGEQIIDYKSPYKEFIGFPPKIESIEEN